MPDDGASDDHSAVFHLAERTEVVMGGNLEDRRGRSHRPGPGSRLPLLHPGSGVFRYRSEGHLGRSRPGCTGPVQRNTWSRGGVLAEHCILTLDSWIFLSMASSSSCTECSSNVSSPALKGRHKSAIKANNSETMVNICLCVCVFVCVNKVLAVLAAPGLALLTGHKLIADSGKKN